LKANNEFVTDQPEGCSTVSDLQLQKYMSPYLL